MGLFGKSKKEREKEYMSKLDVPSCLKENFELIIDDAFTIMGVGTVATGNILIGMCREGENACIYKANGDILESRITTVDVHTKERKANGCGSVSYTHLDVYKRQLLCDSRSGANPLCRGQDLWSGTR